MKATALLVAVQSLETGSIGQRDFHGHGRGYGRLARYACIWLVGCLIAAAAAAAAAGIEPDVRTG